MSFTRFFICGNHSGRARSTSPARHVPANATAAHERLTFTRSLVWPEEPTRERGRLRGGGPRRRHLRGVGAQRRHRTCSTATRTSTITSPSCRPGANAPLGRRAEHPVVITKGQAQRQPVGGVKSLDAAVIAGYNRGTGNDFPRIAWNRAAAGSWWRGTTPACTRSATSGCGPAPRTLGSAGADRQVNDDSDYALHFLPGGQRARERAHLHVVVRPSPMRAGLGARPTTSASAAPAPAQHGADFRITTGATDWTNTSSPDHAQLRRLHRQRQRRHDDLLHLVGRPARGAAAVRGQPLTRHAVVDGLDVVAVGVLDVRGVVAGVVLRP